jgi:hypothetical protein
MSSATSPQTQRALLLRLSRPETPPATSPPREPVTSPWIGHPKRLSVKFDPSTMTPYPYPCFTTSATTQNRITGGEPSLSSGDRVSLPAGPPRLVPHNTVSPSPSLARGPAPTTPSPRLSRWQAELGRPPAWPRARVRSLGRNPPGPS